MQHSQITTSRVPEELRARTETLLLVHDDTAFRGLLARALAARGCEVEQGADAAQAELLVSQRSFTAAIVDLWLPGGSGLEVMRLLKRNFQKVSGLKA